MTTPRWGPSWRPRWATRAAAVTGHLGARLPLGALAAGPAILHPLALAYVAIGCAMISRTLRVPKP